MELRPPIHLGGEYELTAVSVGRTPDEGRVRDCPVCGGYVFENDWHLRATVRSGRSPATESYVYCDASCLRAWLRPFPATDPETGQPSPSSSGERTRSR
jgi:hypothetical protein